LTDAGDTTVHLEEIRINIWRARGRRSRLAGSVMLVWGALFLILAYFTRYIVFEIISIIGLFLGVILVFTTMERFVKLRVANRAMLSSMLMIIDVLRDQSMTGKATFISDGGRIWVAKSSNPHLMLKPEFLNGPVFQSTGLLITSPGRGLRESYEDEIGSLKDRGLEYVLHWLPRVISQALSLSDETEVSIEGNRVQTRLLHPVVQSLCVSKEMNENICQTIGCPLTASIGETLAISVGRPVRHLRCLYDTGRDEATAVHIIGEA
jgi:hypothetical protein